MQDKKIVLENIKKIHTTEMGIDRIKKNLQLNLNKKEEIVNYCKKKIIDDKSNIYKKGKTIIVK